MERQSTERPYAQPTKMRTLPLESVGGDLSNPWSQSTPQSYENVGLPFAWVFADPSLGNDTNNKRAKRLTLWAITLLMQSHRNKELMELLGTPLDDEVKLLICAYFIRERFELNGKVTSTLLSIVSQNGFQTVQPPDQQNSLAQQVDSILKSTFQDASFWDSGDQGEKVPLTDLPKWWNSK